MDQQSNLPVVAALLSPQSNEWNTCLLYTSPALAVVIAMVAGIIILLQLLPRLVQTVDVFRQLAERVNLNNVYLTTILKIIGITYVAEFGAQICRDSGQGALATKVELAAKVIIMMMAVPIMAAILDAVWKLLP